MQFFLGKWALPHHGSILGTTCMSFILGHHAPCPHYPREKVIKVVANHVFFERNAKTKMFELGPGKLDLLLCISACCLLHLRPAANDTPIIDDCSAVYRFAALSV